jgi:hypothetical protein
MKTKFFLAFAIGFLFISSPLRAQEDSIHTNEENNSQFRVGLFYNLNLNYYGRTDSLKSSGFFPVAELWFTKNFYVTATPVFVNNKTTSFDYAGTVATAGLQFNDNKWFCNLSFIKPFYESNSQLVQSALKAQGVLSAAWLNKWLNITSGTDIKFSDKIDYGITAGVDHIFRFEFANNSMLVANPSAYINAGTQQFTQAYYNKFNFLVFPTIEEKLSEEVRKFNVLSYEFSLPLIFSKGKFQLLFTPANVIPQNLITVEGRPDLSERGQKNVQYYYGSQINAIIIVH